MIQKQDQVLDHSPTALNLSIVTWDFVCVCVCGGGGGVLLFCGVFFCSSKLKEWLAGKKFNQAQDLSKAVSSELSILIKILNCVIGAYNF